MKIIIKVMGELQNIMTSLWSFQMMTLYLSHKENEKCEFKNYVIVMLK